MNKSLTEYFQGNLSEAIIREAQRVISDDTPWHEKYGLIFSNEIFKCFALINPSFGYYDPDTSYEDDVMAWFNAAQNFIAQK